MEKEEYYYRVHLEVALKKSKYVFGFINISHIPYEKFEEIFRDQVTSERFLFDDSIGYIIDKELYSRHKEYLDKEVPFNFDFKIFDYSVGLSVGKMSKLEKSYYEELPQFFSGR